MIIAHLPSGYILANLFQKYMPHAPASAFAVVAAAMVGAIAPDFDILYFYFIDHRQTNHHKYLTHWPVVWLMLAVVSLLWFNRAKQCASAFLAVVFSLGGILHLILDSFIGDIWWFAPFVDQPYAMFTVSAKFKPWGLNFILHWFFAVELAICLWALLLYRRRSRRALPYLMKI